MALLFCPGPAPAMQQPEALERLPGTRQLGLKVEGFEGAPIPLLIVTTAGRLMEANAAASELFESGLLRAEGGDLSFGPPASDERFRALLRSRDPEPRPRELVLTGHDARPVRLQVRRLSDGYHLLLVRRLVGDSTPALDALAEVYHLTTSEQRLLEHLVAGLSPREAADALDISVNTVRTYIRSLLLKSDQRNLSLLLCHAIQMA